VDDERKGGPDYHQRLMINVGYYNSYKALRTARNMPNRVQRKFLASKYQIKRDRKRVRDELIEGVE
jgi:hypothetical protein